MSTLNGGGSGSASVNNSQESTKTEGENTTKPPTPPSTPVKVPSWQMDLLMEKLRQKAGALKPLTETAKNIRVALLERRAIMDQGDKSHLQKCLDLLQQSIKVNSLQSMVERLEMISRQQGLKFNSGATGNEWFISSDMFYLELLIDPNGVVQEVKIQHDGKSEQQNCPEIAESLKKNDFQDFTVHLEGLVSIYQLNADKKIKSKAFIALQALETDLCTLASSYSHYTDGELIVMKSLLGYLQPRKGGHPIRLIFYISPYEFLDITTKSILPVDTNTISERKLGTSATISIQPFASQKLQMSTIVSISRTGDGKSVPRYGVLNATNSTALPACFSISLKQGIPICKELLDAIQTSTGITIADYTDAQPILSLIAQHTSKGALDCNNSRGLFVTLPDQVHCYFMTQTQNLEGIVVSNICFTLASQLPTVINILRQQLAFNTLVASCVRVGDAPDMEYIVFEVNALSHQNLAVSFQHPLEDSLVTLEFDLKDVSHPQCHLHAVTNVADIIPTLEEHACKVVQRSMSIPITLRAVIRRWQSLKSKYEPPNPDYSVPVGGSLFGDSKMPSSEMSCGAESERAQQHQLQQPNQQVPGMVMNLGSSPSSAHVSPGKSTNYSKAQSFGGRGSQSPAYTISPIGTPTSTAMNFPMPQNPSMDLLNPYMNPLLFQNMGGLSLQNMQNYQNFPQNMSPAKMAMQISMLATQMQNQQQLQGNQGQQMSQKSSAMLMSLMDQAGQRGRRRKRKGMSSDSLSPLGSCSSGPNVSRPSPSPSPISASGLPRQPSAGKSPKRRPSEGSDISESNDGNSRSTTPQTPTNTAIGLLMSELGLENPDPRWNIDITPVTSSSGSSGMNIPSMESFIANKLFGNSSSSGMEFPNVDAFLQNLGDADMEIDAADPSFGKKFSLPKKAGPMRGPSNFPKRSMSLDSSQLGLGHGLETDSASPSLQSLLQQKDASGVDSTFKPLVTPSLSITPVSTNSSLGSSAVNSLLANIRPGIEIIPLPNPVTIPNSITVTPILPKGATSTLAGIGDKKPLLIKKEDGTDSTFAGKKRTLDKKDRKRKVGVIIEEEKDSSGNGGKQLKLMSGFGSIGNPGSSMSMSLKQGSASTMSPARPNVGVQLKKQNSSSAILGRPPTLKTSGSPTPKMGVSQGKPSVSTLKSVSGSPKFAGGQALGAGGIPGSMIKVKLNKDKSKVGMPGAASKVPKNLSAFGGNQLMKLMRESQLNDMSMILNDMQAGIQADQQLQQAMAAAQQSSVAAASNPGKGVLDMTRAQLGGNPVTSTASSTAGANQATIKQSGGLGAGNNIQAGIKKGGLAAVIDKLKSAASGDGEAIGGNGGSKKDMSKQDYIKASSTITSELQRKNGNGGGPPSSATIVPGNATGANQEYMVKPNLLGGLKLTINKTKGLANSGKDKLKAGIKAPNPSMKRPFLQGGVKSAASPSATFPPKGLTITKKKLEKDSSPKSQQSMKGPSPPLPNQTKPKPGEEIDLTKKLFMPGAVRGLESGKFDGPKFDSNFQIPKKSRTVPPLATALEKGEQGKDKAAGQEGSSGTTADKTKFAVTTTVEKLIEAAADSPALSEPGIDTLKIFDSDSKDFGDNSTVADEDGRMDFNNMPMNLSQSSNVPKSQSPVEELAAIEEEEKSLTTATLSPIEEPEPPTLPVSETSATTLEEKPSAPESPDPGSFAEDDDIYKPTPTIPTTPQRSVPPPPAVVERPQSNSSPPSPEDDDHLIMDIPSDNSSSSLKIAENVSIDPSPKEVDLDEAENLSTGNGSSTDLNMPPPLPPVPLFDSAASPNSPSPPVMSPSVVAAPVPIVSVHIVHSPQPNSPALLRSPLVVASPHSSLASPFTVDDDLMDEAVIGAGN